MGLVGAARGRGGAVEGRVGRPGGYEGHHARLPLPPHVVGGAAEELAVVPEAVGRHGHGGGHPVGADVLRRDSLLTPVLLQPRPRPRQVVGGHGLDVAGDDGGGSTGGSLGPLSGDACTHGRVCKGFKFLFKFRVKFRVKFHSQIQIQIQNTLFR